MTSRQKYVIGIDYGTDSVRSVLLDNSGEQMAESVHRYARWSEGKYCDPTANRFRHHPLDYLEGLEQTLAGVLDQVPAEVLQNVRGIAVDTTGSTPVAVDKTGTPLGLLEEYAKNPNAMFILWKDHTAVQEAEEMIELERLSLENAEENLELANKSYRAGVGTNIDVINAQTRYRQAQISLLQAKYKYEIDLFRVLYKTGQISEYFEEVI